MAYNSYNLSRDKVDDGDASELKKLMTDKDVEEYLGLGKGTIKVWRYLGKGPDFIKIERYVRYYREDVDFWLNANKVKTG